MRFTSRLKPPTHSMYQSVLLALSLAQWSWRPNRLLLLTMCLGMSAAVLLLCAIPLLEQVTGTASLRQALRVSPENTRITISAEAQALSPQLLASMTSASTAPFKEHLAPYLTQDQPAQYRVYGFPLVSPAGPDSEDQLGFISTNIQQMRSHVRLLSGRFPSSQQHSEPEVLLTQESAALLRVSPGATITTSVGYYTSVEDKDTSQFADTSYKRTTRLTLRVVGLIAANTSDIFWHGTSFLPTPLIPDHTRPLSFPLLLSSDALGAWCQEQFSQAQASDTTNSQPSSPEAFVFDSTVFAYWDLFIDPSRLSIDRYASFREALRSTDLDFYNGVALHSYMLRNLPSPYLLNLSYGSPLVGTGPSVLNQLSTHITLSRVPVLIISLPTILLDLFFMSVLISLLIERQSSGIALLRSRGASALQIICAFSLQGLVVSLIAFIIGILLAPLVVSTITRPLLPSLAQDTTMILWQQPMVTLQSVIPYALLALLAGMGSMLFTLAQSLRLNVLTQRYESARVTLRPYWERFYLDAISAVIALVLYLIANYVFQLQGLLSDDTIYAIATPVALLAPFFFMLSILFCFLRFAPRGLNLLARLAHRGRTAPPMLALAQMTRSPRRPLQITLLLALASSFIMLTLIFNDSQQQRLTELASYESVADFSGSFVGKVKPSITNAYQTYNALLGVSAVSLGSEIVSFQDKSHSIRIRAVDAKTYARATYWSTQNSEQPLEALTRELARQRPTTSYPQAVSALVDTLGWEQLHLSPGKTFTLTSYDSGHAYTTTYKALARVNMIEGMYDSPSSTDQSATPALLVDYQTLAAYHAQTDKQPLPLTRAWLRTSDNLAFLARLRAQLNGSDEVGLANLQDRRALLEALRTDPLTLDLLLLLALGTTIALLLGLCGNILITWNSIHERQLGFAVLRALGTEPPLVARILIWEQGVIHLVALFFGVVFGLLFTFTLIPRLMISSTPVNNALGNVTSLDFYMLQRTVQVQVQAPTSLALAFLAFALVCVLIIFLVTRHVLHLLPAQALRLNKD
ncbi:FtsX-like permease family protein [Ktedonobacter racemifer]|uniref:ABC3 transporter permease C-terminal domain-containing protein n=1 Tax=Ktedonobacter racemifer DSM 44963 TaxID=485913 RepID=D6U7N2_KTERA|nr:FtsX-like permease family protein [Ktedonobacter racemifer]EFH79893.1 protein of unknown function DUF214 [Ktedonobacter racemifer DSM 44963]